jgi:hypothetical protein
MFHNSLWYDNWATDESSYKSENEGGGVGVKLEKRCCTSGLVNIHILWVTLWVFQNVYNLWIW